MRQIFRIAAGSMAVLIAVGFALIGPAPARGATTFVVNKTGDAADLNLANSKCDSSSKSGNQCTLRAAIQEANDTAGADTINFNITGSGNKVIAPGSPLPTITGTLTINGFSQSGTSANTKAVGNNAVLRIVLDGVNAGVDSVGLSVKSNNSTIRGLVLQRWSGAGIDLAGSGNTVSGNFVGTSATGTAARGNGIGIHVEGASHTIGGSTPGARNVISGNDDQGMWLANVTGTLIAGNYIGTNAAGTAALSNFDSGVHFDGGTNNIVGNGAGGAPNVISGNDRAGLLFDGTGNSHILGNLIGTDAAGTSAVKNGQDGIAFFEAFSNTIGGTSAGHRNTISANQVGIGFNDSDGNTVLGNRIGTRADGTGNLGNRFGGISISGSDNQIGGAGSAAGNVIANSVNGHGIYVASNNLPVDTLIQGNSIVNHAEHGIYVRSGSTQNPRQPDRRQQEKRHTDWRPRLQPRERAGVGQHRARERRSGHQSSPRHGSRLRRDAKRLRRRRLRLQPSSELSRHHVGDPPGQRFDHDQHVAQQHREHRVPHRALRGRTGSEWTRRGTSANRRTDDHYERIWQSKLRISARGARPQPAADSDCNQRSDRRHVGVLAERGHSSVAIASVGWASAPDSLALRSSR